MHEIHPAHSPQASTTNHFDTVQRLHMVGEQGIAVINFPVTQGIRARPVDLLVITPTGCYVIEVVRTENKGDLYAPDRGPWMVGETTAPFGNTESNPAQLALKARDLLAHVFAAHGVDGSFLTPMVAIHTQWMRLPGDATYINVNSVQVTTLNNLRKVGLPHTGHTLGVPEALAILGMIGIPADLVPGEHVFAREGFAMPTEGTFQAPDSPYFTGLGAHAPRQPGAAGFMRNLLESSGDTNGIQSKWGRRASLGLAAFDQAKNLYEGHAERKRAEQHALGQTPTHPHHGHSGPGHPYPHQHSGFQAQQPYPPSAYPDHQAEAPYSQPYPDQVAPPPPIGQQPDAQVPPPPGGLPTGADGQTPPLETQPGTQPHSQPYPTHQPASSYTSGHDAYGDPTAFTAPPPAARKRPMRAWDATVTVLTITFWFLALMAFIVTRYDRGITATVTSYYALALVLAGCALPLIYLIQRHHIAQQVSTQQTVNTEPPQQ